MNRFALGPSLFAYIVLCSTAFADKNRMTDLVNSDLMERYSLHLGPCETEVFDYAIELNCMQAKVDVRIEVQTAYDSSPFGSGRQRYIEQRKLYCLSLVSNRDGRCIGTDDAQARVGLRGYRSQSIENSNERRTEIVVFYGPEMLRAIATTTGGDTGWLLDHLMKESLARLTPRW